MRVLWWSSTGKGIGAVCGRRSQAAADAATVPKYVKPSGGLLTAGAIVHETAVRCRSVHGRVSAVRGIFLRVYLAVCTHFRGSRISVGCPVVLGEYAV